MNEFMFSSFFLPSDRFYCYYFCCIFFFLYFQISLSQTFPPPPPLNLSITPSSIALNSSESWQDVYINCGGQAINGLHNWKADDFITTGKTSSNTKNYWFENMSMDSEMYSTCRVFGAQDPAFNTYSIKVQSGHYYCVKLYFADILSQIGYSQIFSVEISGVRVIDDIEFPLVNSAYEHEVFVYLSEDELNITFVRGKFGDPFINGISIHMVNSSVYYDLMNPETLLHTIHRVNCGGTNATRDSIGRLWLPDENYSINEQDKTMRRNFSYLKETLTKASTVGADPTLLFPPEILEVERTTSIGYPFDGKKEYGLIYNFSVRKERTYFIRLGFIESLLPWSKSRSLSLKFNGEEKDYFDVVNEVDYLNLLLKNYTVQVSSPELRIEIILKNFTNFTRDAFINTIEILETHNMIPTATLGNPPNKMVKGYVWAVIAFAAALVVLISLIFIFRKQELREHFTFGAKDALIKKKSSRKNSKSGSVKSLLTSSSSHSGSNGARLFAIREIEKATRKFSEDMILGKGGFGHVYRGVLLDGVQVAIKRLDAHSDQGEREFSMEVDLLTRLHHRNLVNLVGFCDENDCMMLVYEYMPNGTLRDFIKDEEKFKQLDWSTCLDILLGSARGIEYLHKGATPPVIHRDIKTSNILLDKNLEAKVADFGLSKLGKIEEGLEMLPSHFSTNVKGTLGYMDPNYYKKQQLTEKSDVYSFGVVILELLTGRLPIWDEGENEGKVEREEGEKEGEGVGEEEDVYNLVEWTTPYLKSGKINAILTSHLKNNTFTISSITKAALLASLCVNHQAKSRPDMSAVVRELQEAKNLLMASVNIDVHNSIVEEEGEGKDDSEMKVEINHGLENTKKDWDESLHW